MSDEERATLRSLAARALARAALVDIKLVLSPVMTDYEATAELLAHAHELDPADTDILRLLIDAQTQAGRTGEAAALTRELVKLDPSDTVAQLSVLSARINALQDVDARLRAFEGLLGPSGESLDPALRSRLAMDAALLLRERGDAEGFARRLRESLKLDPSNKDAAALLYAFVTGGDATPQSELEALLVLLYADPIDAQTHAQIGRLLAREGVAPASLRFMDNAREIISRFGGRSDGQVEGDYFLAEWRTRGAASILQRLADEVDRPRRDVAQRLEALNKAGKDTSIYAKPEDIRLPMELERLWAAAASAAGNEAALDRAIGEMTESAHLADLAVTDPSRRPKDFSDEDARDEAARRRTELVRMLLLTNAKTEKLAEQVEEVGKLPGTTAEARQILEGWLAVRTGVTAAAELKLAPLKDAEPLAALGLAVLAHDQGDQAVAAAGYEDAALRLSGTITGAWAEDRHKAITGKPVRRGPAASALSEMAAAVPAWMNDLLRNPNRIGRLSVGVSGTNIKPLDRLKVEIRLRNTSPIPLALGAEKPLNSRFLLAPSIEIGAQPMGNALPTVANLDRRLRLKPNEELVVSVWPDSGFAGWFMELAGGQRTRSRYRVIQGFRNRGDGAMDAGPLSLATETTSVGREAFSRMALPVADLVARVRDASWAELPDVLGVLRYRLYRDARGLDRLGVEIRSEIAAALVDRYAGADPDGRALMLAMLPPGAFLTALADFDLAIATMPEDRPSERAAKVLLRAKAPDEPLIQSALADADARVRAAGRVMAARLADAAARTYSRFSAGITPQAPVEPVLGPDGATGEGDKEKQLPPPAPTKGGTPGARGG
jgi:tetratricopeptide (TPR) repeat protein